MPITPITRIACWIAFSLLITAMTSAAPAHASLEEITANAGDSQRNLLRLVILLRRLQASDTLPTELADVVDALDAADPQTLSAARTLRTLLPSVNRLQTVKDRVRPAKRYIGAMRLNDPRTGGRWGRLRRFESADGVEPKRWQLWLDAHQDDSEQDDKDGFDGFSAESDSVSAGVEFELTKALNLGLNLGRYDTDLTSDVFGEDQQDSTDAALSLSYRHNNHVFSTSVAYTSTDTERIRGVIVGAPTGLRAIRLDADIDADQRSISLGYAGMLFEGDHWQFSAVVSGSYAVLDTDDYVEQGPDGFTLNVKTETSKQVLGAAGGDMSWSLFRGGWLIAPHLTAAVEHDFRADPITTVSRFRDTGPRFKTEGFAVEETRFRYGAGIYFLHERGFGLGLHYDGLRKDDYRYDAATISLQMRF